MRRREFIELAAATASIAVGSGEAAATAAADATVEPGDDRYEAALARFPPPPDGTDRSTVTVSAAPVEAHLTEPALLGDAAVHVGTFAERGAVSTGIGGLDADARRRYLDERGYDRRDPVAGRDHYGRWANGRYRGVVVEDDAVHVGLGADPATVTRLVDGSLPDGGDTLADDPAVATALERVGPMTVAAIERRGGEATSEPDPDPTSNADGDAVSPVVVARRLSLRGDRASIREVEVHESTAAARRAADRGGESWVLSWGAVTLHGTSRVDRAVVRDADVDVADLPDPLAETGRGGN